MKRHYTTYKNRLLVNLGIITGDFVFIINCKLSSLIIHASNVIILNSRISNLSINANKINIVNSNVSSIELLSKSKCIFKQKNSNINLLTVCYSPDLLLTNVKLKELIVDNNAKIINNNSIIDKHEVQLIPYNKLIKEFFC